MKGTLTHASDMLRELRTGLLTPKSYYELYMKVLDELRYVEDYFTGLQKQGKPVVELYEKVQSCGNVLPRLYLLITVAGVYIKSLEAPARDILKDLVEMSKGVQHPMRGLFLRNYLSQVSRDKLPDVGTPYEGEEGGSVQDAYEFILQNFSEANRLWCRMQQQPTNAHNKEKKRREKERQELRILVGTNLVRLSQLQGVEAATYKEHILPRLLEQVVQCKDTLAQSYLMECIVQVFGDEFHIATLDLFLAACTQLKEKVNVRAILEGVMDRLATFAEANPAAIPPHLRTFDMFNTCVSKLLVERPGYSVVEVLRLQASLLNYALHSFPGNLEYLNLCLGNCATALADKRAAHQEQAVIVAPLPFALDSEGVEVVERLLTLPLACLALKVLELPHFASLLEFLPWASRRQVGVTLLQAVYNSRAKLSNLESVEKLLEMVVPVIKEEPPSVLGSEEAQALRRQQNGERGVEDAEEEDETGASRSRGGGCTGSTENGKARRLEEEQLLLGRLVHVMASPDTDMHFRFLAVARRHFSEAPKDRFQYTFPPLVLATLQLVRRVRRREVAAEGADGNQEGDTQGGRAASEGASEQVAVEDGNGVLGLKKRDVPGMQFGCRKLFQAVHEMLTSLAPHFANLALKLFLEAAQAADRCEADAFKLISYEFVTQAFLLYEDEVTDSKTQIRALTAMIGTLLQARHFDESDYDALSTKVTQYAAKLLKKPDQCRMVALASHLFFVGRADEPGHYHDPKRVIECLQRSVKTADMCMASSQHMHLFVEVLNHYLYFYECGCPTVTEKYLSALVAFINDKRNEAALVGGGPAEGSSRAAEIEAYYKNTLDYIRLKKTQTDNKELADRFSAIQV